MEISPIPGIRAVVSGVKPRSVDPELTALFDIESSARPGDDTYTGHGQKAAGAEENDESETEEMAEEIEETSADEVSSSARPGSPAGQISFFA